MKSICIDCGMCSDGTMFRYAAITEGDRLEPLNAAGATFVTNEGRTSFLLPCPAFKSGACSIYDHRPEVCRDYRCFLLRRYEAGEVSFDDARALIERTMVLRDRVRPALIAFTDTRESLALSGLYRRLEEMLDATPDPARARRHVADQLLDIAALRVILAREFEPRPTKDVARDGGGALDPTAEELSGRVDRAVRD